MAQFIKAANSRHLLFGDECFNTQFCSDLPCGRAPFWDQDYSLQHGAESERISSSFGGCLRRFMFTSVHGFLTGVGRGGEALLKIKL